MTWEIPSWLNDVFLVDVLQRDDKQLVSIVKFSAKPAVALGENYSSQIFKVCVQYKTESSVTEQSASLIIKAPHTKGIILEFSGFLDVFTNEKRIYTELLPMMYQIIHRHFGPKFFHCPVDNVLVLQDLGEEGYVMAKRHEQLNFNHCALVLSTLAKFHACSVAIHKDNPSLVEDLGREIMYSKDSLLGPQLKEWLKPVLNIIGEILKKTDGCEQYVDLLSSKPDIWDSVVESFKPRLDRLNVLNHGDCWVNNMLFRYDDSGDPIKVKFVDFAISRYSTPAADIAYFIWSSANEEVREDRLEDLTDIYLQSLNLALEQLSCEERMSKSELTKELKSLSDWTFTLVCQMLPVVLTDPKDAINVEEITKADMDINNPSQQMVKMFQGKRFLAALPTALRQYQRWMDILN